MTLPASSVAVHKAGDDARTSLRTWLRLLACTNLVEREVRGRLRDRFDTTLPRFDVLAQLDAAARESRAGLTMSDLSRRLMVTNGNLTSLVERLVREGLVKRETLATDRRTQIVRLSPAGKRSLDAMTPEHQRWIDSLFAGLTPTERTRLYELLGKLRNSVQNSLADEDGK
jgi:DNA-binding MarR family transcriptional regulator